MAYYNGINYDVLIEVSDFFTFAPSDDLDFDLSTYF